MKFKDVLEMKPEIAYAITEKSTNNRFEVISYNRADGGYVEDKTYLWEDRGFQNDSDSQIFNEITNYKYVNFYVNSPYYALLDFCFKFPYRIKVSNSLKSNLEQGVFNKPVNGRTPLLKDICVEMREFSDRMVSWTDVDYIVKTQRWW